MGSFDNLPSLVAELRELRSRVSEMERQRLGVPGQTTVAQALGATGVDGLEVFGSDTTIVSVDLDTRGKPMLVFFSTTLATRNTATSGSQVGFNLYAGDALLAGSERVANVQGGADTTTVTSIVAAVDVPGGETTFEARAVIRQMVNPADPNPHVYDCTLAVLRLGTLIGGG